MKGLMQEQPLNIPALIRHARRLHSAKTVTTNTDGGPSVRTFAETIDRSQRLMSALRSLGVTGDDRVATFCWNSQAHLETYIAAPCMGAVLHTLNIRLFPNDLAYIVKHAEDSVVIVDKSLWPAWEKVAAQVSGIKHVIVVDDIEGPAPAGTLDYEELLAGHDLLPFDDDIPENQAAAMCYTSGTTGNPKGVVYTHRSTYLHSIAVGLADSIGLRETDVVMPIVPMFHANAWGIPYAGLVFGADMVLPGRFMTPDALAQLMVDRQVTLGFGVPTIWLGMLEPLKKVRDQLNLHTIVCGGSAVPRALLDAYQRDLGVPILHAWGMTEMSPVGSVARLLAAHSGLTEQQVGDVRSTQGRVVPGIDMRLGDDAGNELPWDGQTVGEIQVRGNWIASSYYNDDSSPEKFVDGWLRTGDVATIDGQGLIRIVDRTKDLVKSGGEWISSVELEGHIMAHPDVAEAAVVALPHPRWDERPLACVVRRPGTEATLTRETLMAFLEPRVAKWWLPDDIVFIDEVPKTSVGKFDKKVLRERFKDHVLPEVATRA